MQIRAMSPNRCVRASNRRPVLLVRHQRSAKTGTRFEVASVLQAARSISGALEAGRVQDDQNYHTTQHYRRRRRATAAATADATRNTARANLVAAPPQPR